MTKRESKGEAEESNRMWASASFVGVLIIIGLPLWWKTTEVYRVAIPSDKIAALDTLNHKTTAELVLISNDDVAAAEVAGLVEREFEDSDVISLNITTSSLASLHRVESAIYEREAVEQFSAAFDLSKRNVFYVVQKKNLRMQVWLGTERVMLFKDASAATTIVEALRKWVYQTSILEGARSETADAARQIRFPPSPSYQIVLSVIQPEPMEFDAEHAVEDYIGSFVDELSDLHNFTLKSQFLYMLNFDFQAKQVADTSEWGRHFAVPKDRLPLLLTRLEERAASGAPEPAISLALYVPPCAAAPLLIYDHDEPIATPVQAFMSPKWGGVVLWSPTRGDCAGAGGTWSPDVRFIMGAFLSQLRELIGLHHTGYVLGAHLEPLRGVAPRAWEVDALLRLRTLEQLVAARRTLQSLAQLLGEISNIVINDEVGASIKEAVDSTYLAGELMRRGELLAAHQAARLGASAAETAFTEPSLLALLYFPDDQKYAIYIPLFLPIMFPVIFSLKNLILWFRGRPIHKKSE